MDISNSVIAITGAAQGLGKDMALHLAKRGAKLALIDLDEQKLAQCQIECEKLGSPQSNIYPANVAQEHQVEEVFQRIPQDLGGINGLINNAGIIRDGLLIKKSEDGFKKLPMDKWQSVLDVNLTGVFLCARECALQMAQLEQSGCIINISSISRSGNMGQSNYSAAKSGVAAMAVVWAKELAQYGIRANAIAPGFIATEMTSSMPQPVLDKITAGIPLGRMGQGDEIAHTVAFLLENEYISGRIIEVDGGLRI